MANKLHRKGTDPSLLFAGLLVCLIQMTSFFQALLQKQQTMLRKQREAVEYASTRTVEEQLATEQAERVREQLRAVQEAERAAAILKAEKEEAAREAERQELLRQQQREENDDEEVKIRTLAYSHTREWYQPDKKCFSHRGRQLCVAFCLFACLGNTRLAFV